MSHVQVRDVPDDVVAALKSRAAETGQSLQRFLLEILVEEADVAGNAALLDEASADSGGYPAAPGEAADVVRQGRQQRDPTLIESLR